MAGLIFAFWTRLRIVCDASYPGPRQRAMATGKCSLGSCGRVVWLRHGMLA